MRRGAQQGRGWWWLALGLLVALAPESGAARFRPAVAVLTLQNLSTYGGRLMGRRAADQLALELGQTGAWRVLDRAQTDRACLQRDLAPPFAVGDMQQIGHALGADLVFGGAVQQVGVDPRSGAVRVTVYLEAVDQLSGQSVLGSQQTSEARRNAAAPVPTDVLVSQALAQACGQAARLVAGGPGLEGEATGPGDGKTVALKMTGSEPLGAGQRLLLYRAEGEGEQRVPGKLIASLMVVKATAGAVEARILARSGDLHTGDLVVTIGAAPARPAGGQRP